MRIAFMDESFSYIRTQFLILGTHSHYATMSQPWFVSHAPSLPIYSLWRRLTSSVCEQWSQWMYVFSPSRSCRYPLAPDSPTLVSWRSLPLVSPVYPTVIMDKKIFQKSAGLKKKNAKKLKGIIKKGVSWTLLPKLINDQVSINK